ncbi:fatty-acid amide hydrolase 2 isoform X2 [Fopius arisanus]|uniref:FAAH2_5 protein n=1 Tax=Fopius arisanus TaxID=64838 RepID=A0A0C9R1J7_9HYME|nr:PREDICTED: fatty-acid amide hydrolase 2 isoform X2 [Fopius arisanus]
MTKIMCTSITNHQVDKLEGETMMETSKKLLCSLIRCIIVQLHYVFDCIIDFVFGLYYNGKEEKVPPIKNTILLESAIMLAEKIRNKKLSCQTVVNTFIERCKEVNGTINVIVDERYDEAMKEARRVDELLACDIDIDILKITKPFLGVPFTTKESNEAKGLLHSMGMVARKGHRSTQDATVIANVKESGAILIAKTNIPEMNLWVESRNLIYGQTNNPYNSTRAVGGSSGGDAAVTAACGVPFSVGSDIGGSIRMPAFFNGVFGLKPSERATPLRGIGLRTEDSADSMAEAGPICKCAEDLLPLLKIMITDKDLKEKLDTPVNIKKVRVFYQEGSGDLRASRINPEMRAALTKVVQHLEKAADSVQRIKLPGSEYSFRLWRYWMTQEGADFKSDITNRQSRTSASAELIKLIMNKSEITFAAILKLIDEDFFPKEDSEWAEEVTAEMKDYLMKKLGDNGVLVYPSSPFPASYHHSYFFRPYNFGYWCLFNVLRLPTCQVPMGLDSEGMPVGVQIVAAPQHDHLCIAIARELEKTFGGWVPPSMVMPQN